MEGVSFRPAIGGQFSGGGDNRFVGPIVRLPRTDTSGLELSLNGPFRATEGSSSTSGATARSTSLAPRDGTRRSSHPRLKEGQRSPENMRKGDGHECRQD